MYQDHHPEEIFEEFFHICRYLNLGQQILNHFVSSGQSHKFTESQKSVKGDSFQELGKFESVRQLAVTSSILADIAQKHDQVYGHRADSIHQEPTFQIPQSKLLPVSQQYASVDLLC